MKLNFSAKVLKIVAKIPRGKVSTYKLVAQAIGQPLAARAVGNTLHNNKKPIVIPCHRVIKSDGTLGGYSRGLKKKKALLRKEGINIDKNRVLHFHKYLFTFK